MLGQRKRAKRALEKLNLVLDRPQTENESTKLLALDAVSALEPGTPLREMCEKLIDAGDTERAIKLLTAASTSGGFARTLGVSVAAILPVVLIVAFAAEPFGSGQATITTQTDACAEALFAGLEFVRDHGGMGYTTTEADAQALMTTGTVSMSYGRDGARYEISFRVRARGERCELQAYRLRTRMPGSTETRRGDFGTVDLDGCECE